MRRPHSTVRGPTWYGRRTTCSSPGRSSSTPPGRFCPGRCPKSGNPDERGGDDDGETTPHGTFGRAGPARMQRRSNAKVSARRCAKHRDPSSCRSRRNVGRVRREGEARTGIRGEAAGDGCGGRHGGGGPPGGGWGGGGGGGGGDR